MRDNGRGDKSLCPSSGYLQRENKARFSLLADLFPQEPLRFVPNAALAR